LKFNYDGNKERDFELKCNNEQTRDKWFDTLSFLITVVEKIGDIDVIWTSSTATYFSNNSDGKDEKKRPNSESHKFKNFDSETQKAVVKQEDALFSNKKEQQRNSMALEKKGIWQYIKKIDPLLL